ncbi:hypothetical protein GCM10010124_40280 [Pilimelia terevasa]|uniref:Core-binding (CB) domain-containing protein n=1 Tax=Pilimelia terevasa TaxID=53372 RepID=A0A8J3BQM9_9ACTN|nr:N-terminal phage integrase SAM-like domain-containing protein [Pilimelia terevasa]GGK43452.1 hypothetical protein GCM10010124_40280 [Pilimelia terevasa]
MPRPDNSITKRCTCRKPNKKFVGVTCPKLRRADGTWNPHHGTWTVQVELPNTADGTRRQFRRYGYPLREDAVDYRDAVRELLALAGDDLDVRRKVADLLQGLKQGEPLPDRDAVSRRIRAGVAVHADNLTGDYLREWLDSRRGKLSPKTVRNYDDHIRLYFQPEIGDVPLQKLRTHHIQDVFNAIDDRNDEILEARESRDSAVRKTVKGVRPVGAASQQRVKATIRKALNDAIRVHRLIEYNPAIHIELRRRPTQAQAVDEEGDRAVAAHRGAALTGDGLDPGPVRSVPRLRPRTRPGHRTGLRTHRPTRAASGRGMRAARRRGRP